MSVYIETSFALYVLVMVSMEECLCLLIIAVVVILVFIVRKENKGLGGKSNFIYPEVAPVPWSKTSGNWRYPCPGGGRCPWSESGWWWPQAQKYFW